MVPEGADYPASNTTLGESLNNWTLAEKRDLAAWAGGGEGCTGGIADDGGRRRQWSETSNALSAEGEPGLEVERLERQSGAPKWGAAELLSTRLARYMLPDGPIPEVRHGVLPSLSLSFFLGTSICTATWTIFASGVNEPMELSKA